MNRWEEAGWQQEDLNKLELSFLQRVFELKDEESVDTVVSYAKFLNKMGINSDTYPVYLKILEMKNHWVVDALVGKLDPEAYFKNIQPNYFILAECFKAFKQAQRGGIYPKSLLVYFGLLQTSFKNPLEGYRIYPLTPEDVNHLGKHLDETKDQTFPVNKSILEILDRIASLIDPGRPEENAELQTTATQANNIRGKFLDMTKSLKEAVPDELLVVSDYKKEEVSPSKSGPAAS